MTSLRRTAIVVLVVVALLALAGFSYYEVQDLHHASMTPSTSTTTIVNSQFYVRPSSYQNYPINVPSGVSSVNLSGQYHGQIQVYVMNSTVFHQYWLNSNLCNCEGNGSFLQHVPPNTYYYSSTAFNGAISIGLPAAQSYYLVFYNTATSTENVTASVSLSYS